MLEHLFGTGSLAHHDALAARDARDRDQLVEGDGDVEAGEVVHPCPANLDVRPLTCVFQSHVS